MTYNKTEAALPFHRLADLFNPLEGKELDELVGDIQRRGLRFPIVTCKGVIIDGRNRAIACLRAGIEPRYEEFDGNEADIARFIISANIHRRHLKPEQRRELIEKFLQADPTKSDRQISSTLKVSPTTVGTVRAKMEKAGDVSKLDTRTDTKGRKQPAKKTQPKKSTSPDRSRSGVSQVPTAPEKPLSELPTGSDSSKNPVLQATVVETQTQPNPIAAASQAMPDTIGPMFDPVPVLYCSFCDKSQHEVECIIVGGSTGATVYICDECVTLCADIVREKKASQPNGDAGKAAPDDGLDIPESLRRAAP